MKLCAVMVVGLTSWYSDIYTAEMGAGKATFARPQVFYKVG